MRSYIPFLILAGGLALWGFGLWRQGFFGQSTLPVERRVYYVRIILLFVAIVVIAWPLELYRKAIGEIAYIAAAAAILALFTGFGLLAAKFMFKLHTKDKRS